MTIGHIAYNSKDLEPLGFIDPIVTMTSPEDTPKGSYSWSWGGEGSTFVTNWGLELPSGFFTYQSVSQDIVAEGVRTVYVVIFTFIYYDIDGVEVAKRTRVVRLVISQIPMIPGDEPGDPPQPAPTEDWPQDTLNTYYLFPESDHSSRIEFEVTGTLQLDPDSDLAQRIVGLQYDDFAVFGRNNVRLLPSDRLGLDLFWSASIVQSSPQGNIPGQGTNLGGVGFGGALSGVIGSFSNQISDLSLTSSSVKWAFQIVNAKTIVDRKIVITQEMLDAPKIDSYMPVKIVGDDEGIMKVLCACDAPLDLNKTELDEIGTNPPTEKIEQSNNRLGYGEGDYGVVWNRTLKQIYRSDYVGDRGAVSQSRKNNNMHDLIGSTILIEVSNEDGTTIQEGHEIYVTYNHVFDFHLRQLAYTYQSFTSIFMGGYAMSFDLTFQKTDVYSWSHSKFWVNKNQTDSYIFSVNSQEEEPEGGPLTIPVGANPFSPILPNANWTNYIEDRELLKLAAENGTPSSQVDTQLIEWYGHRQINSMLYIDSYGLDVGSNKPVFPNGLIVGAYSYDGGNPGGILWINLLNWSEVRVLIPRDQIRDQDWFYEWFRDKVLSERLSGEDLNVGAFTDWERDTWDVFFDQNVFVNSFLTDNQKLAYESFTARALNKCSEFNANDDIESSGIGFSNLDFFIPGTLNPRVEGLPGMDSEYYSDASSSVFLTPPRTSENPGAWSPSVIDSIPGNFGGTSSVTQNATYLYFQPLSLDLNGRVYFESRPATGAQQPFIASVITRPVSTSNVSGSNVNYDRTRGLYCIPDSNGVHTRLFLTDSSVLNSVYSMRVEVSSFGHENFEDSVSYEDLYSFRGLIGDSPIYSNGVRIVPQFGFESFKTDLGVSLTRTSAGFELLLPGNLERLTLYYGEVDRSLLEEGYLTLSIFGDSSNTEIIDIIELSSSGQVDIHVGYLSGTVVITSNIIDSISSMSADLYYIDDEDFEKISKESTSSGIFVDNYGNYNIIELLSEASKTNMSLMRSGKIFGPYSSFPYVFMTIDNEIVSNVLVRSDFKNSYVYLFFVIDGYLMVKRLSYVDLDTSQIFNIDDGFLENGIDESFFTRVGYQGAEYGILSYNKLFDLFNGCNQMADMYLTSSYLIQGDIVNSNEWITNEMLSSMVFNAYSSNVQDSDNYDFSNLSSDDTYSSRVNVEDYIVKAYLRNDNFLLESNGYSSSVDNGFTAEILSNGTLVVFYVHEGKVYGKISSGQSGWRPLFKINDQVSGFKPVRVLGLTSEDIGVDADIDEEIIESLPEEVLSRDLSDSSFNVSAISSCYEPKSDSLYLFYVLDGFLAFHLISGMSLTRDLGESIFDTLDSTTPRSMLKSNRFVDPYFLVGQLPEGMPDAIRIAGNNYLQFKYSIGSIESFNEGSLSVQESPVSAFILNNGIVRFMYIDSNEVLRGGIISGLTTTLDVQLRKND